jgi:hypothetical protein
MRDTDLFVQNTKGLKMTELEEINLDIINERNRFNINIDLLNGFLAALRKENVITEESLQWFGCTIAQIQTHFKAMEIQCHKLKDIIDNKEQWGSN